MIGSRMPDVDGGEVVRRLRQDPATTELAIVLMSGADTEAAPSGRGQPEPFADVPVALA